MVNPKVSKALEEARKLVADLESYEDNLINHQAVVKQTERVRTALEQPINLVTCSIEHLALGSAFHTILDIQAYYAMPENNSTISADKLAQTTNVANTVIHRIYRIAINHEIFTETVPDIYIYNNLLYTLNPKTIEFFFIIFLKLICVWIYLPEYLKLHNPDNIFDLVKFFVVYSVNKKYFGKLYYKLLEIDPDPEYREIWNINIFIVDQLISIVGIFLFIFFKKEIEQNSDCLYLVNIGIGRSQLYFAIQKNINSIFNTKFTVADRLTIGTT